MYEQVLAFWFEQTSPKQWWSVDPAFDELVRERFAALLRQAGQGELFAWRAQPRGRLAEVIVLDQFPRNIHRGTAQAFALDPMALALAQEAVAGGHAQGLQPVERSFLLLPYMHSESALIHIEAERLYRENGLPENYQFELKHKAIIERFGRYPHRNAILGRESTAEERVFLEQPGSSF